MKIRFVSILSALITFFCVVDTKGFDSPTLPASLPMGNRQAMMDWSVTNRFCTVAVGLTYTNTFGEQTNRNILPVTDGYKFVSYESFDNFVVTNGIALYDRYKLTMSPTTTVQFKVRVYYVELSRSSLFIDTNIGLPSQITINSFSKVNPIYVAAVVSTPDLQEFSINVRLNNELDYIYNWSSQGEITTDPDPPHAINLIAKNIIVLNEWFSVSEFHSRITLIAAGKTNTYTQHGDLLVGGKLTMLSKDHVEVTMPKGADVSIESTTDLVNWTVTENTLPWNLGTNKFSLYLIEKQRTPESAQKFYRALYR